MTGENLRGTISYYKKRSGTSNLLEVLVKPLSRVCQGFLGAIHSNCVVTVVSDSPSMGDPMENLDKVINL
jgi:hypothetical protein